MTTDTAPPAPPAAHPTARLDPRPAHQRMELRTRRSGPRIGVDEAATRIAAYVYGNIVTLAAVASLTEEDVASGIAALVLAGVAMSTYLAHALAAGIGRRLHSEHRLAHRDVLVELRGSIPILSSAALPALLMAAAGITGVQALHAQLLGALYLVVRLGLIGVLVARYRGAPSSGRLVAAGLALATVGVVVTLAKVALAH